MKHPIRVIFLVGSLALLLLAASFVYSVVSYEHTGDEWRKGMEKINEVDRAFKESRN